MEQGGERDSGKARAAPLEKRAAVEQMAAGMGKGVSHGNVLGVAARNINRFGTGSGAAKVSSRGEDTPTLLERSPTPSPPALGREGLLKGS
jgi:hypothetical protein